MRNVLLATIALFTFILPVLADPPPRPLAWGKITELYYATGQGQLFGPTNSSMNCLSDSGGDNSLCNAIFVMKYPPPTKSYGPQAQNTPFVVDLRPLLGPPGCCDDAKMAVLTGMLLITHPSNTDIGDIQLTYAAHGSPLDCTRVLGQTATQQFDGERSNATFVVPLNGGKFHYCYKHFGAASTSFGLNFSVQMWGR